MNWLRRSVDRAIAEAVRQHLLSDEFQQAVMRVAMENPRFVFLKQMQQRYQTRRPGLTSRRAFEAARDWLNTFLEWEKIEFGDGRYDWSRDGAAALADEDLSNWECAA